MVAHITLQTALKLGPDDEAKALAREITASLERIKAAVLDLRK